MEHDAEVHANELFSQMLEAQHEPTMDHMLMLMLEALEWFEAQIGAAAEGPFLQELLSRRDVALQLFYVVLAGRPVVSAGFELLLKERARASPHPRLRLFGDLFMYSQEQTAALKQDP